MKKRIVSMVLVVLLLCSMLSISALATDPPYVTVYLTEGMFTKGGLGSPQQYAVNEDPADYLINGFTAIDVPLSSINTTVTRGYYNSALTGSANVLDAIITALISVSETPSCGWDPTTPNPGGYINQYSPHGVPSYGPTSYATIDGHYYAIYTGTGLNIACTQGTTVDKIPLYATNYPVFDGMIIVVDMSEYNIYWQLS